MNTSLKKYIVPFVIFIVLLSNLVLGFFRLGNYSSVDEPYWTYGRISKFWNSVAAHKWKSTSVNDKPGITVAILSGTGLLKIDPLPYQDLRGDPKTDAQLANINTINFFFRLPIFLFCVLLLPLFYVLLKKLFDETTALIAFIFIGLSPILLGISLIINPDSLLWVFLPPSLLSYFVFQKNSEKKYLYLSGVLLGLALLTKYVANILYIFFFLLPFMEYVFASEKPDIRSYLKKSALDFLILAVVSMATFFILYPAAWVNLDILLQGTFLSKAFETTWPIFVGAIALIIADAFLLRSKVTLRTLNFISAHKTLLIRAISSLFLFGIAVVLINTYTGMKFFDTFGTLASPKGSGGGGSRLFIYADNFIADFYSLIFGISPLALFSFVATLLLAFKKKWIDSYEAKIVFSLALFILFYYFASTVNHVVATVRYQITLYPFAFIVAAIGLAHILSLEKIRRFVPLFVAFLVILGVSLASLFLVKPFYFAYNSALLPQKYFVNLKDMGDGSWEAAAYLNALPNAKELTVWSDKGAVCAVFKGNCKIGFTQKDLKNANFDYVVVSSGRKSRSLKLSHPGSDPIDFKTAYQTEETAATITIGNRPNNFVKVIPAALLTPTLSKQTSE